MKKYFVFWLLIAVYLIVFFITSYRLYSRLGVFGCGDECINYTAAYFLHNGKSLYTEIFFNRQPLMAFASLVVQWATQPTSIYTLVMYHRLAVVVYALVAGILLVVRFKTPALYFLILYEGTKFYVYGYQFIGEAIIVYPLVYAFAALWQALLGKKIWSIDWYLLPVFAAVVFWSREPYIPVAFAILSIFYWIKRKDTHIYISMFLSALFCLVPYLWIPMRQYVQQVIEINKVAAGSAFDLKSLLYAFGYPLVVFVAGKESFFRIIQIGIMAFVGIGVYFGIQKTKRYIPFVVMFVILGFAAIRSVPPGVMYFEAFHMLPWYGLACMFCALVVDNISAHNQKIVAAIGFILFCLWAFASPQAFIWEKVDKLSEFESQYAKYSHYSQAIKILTTPTQKIFLDLWDDVIYWESGRPSSYPYSMYIPVAAGVSPYTEARIAMFRDSPPVVYYSCPSLQTTYNSLPFFVQDEYVQLLSSDIPSCLYVHRIVLDSITQDQRQELSRIGYSVPKVR